MMKKTHMGVSLSGALKNWRDSLWEDVCTDENGKTMTPHQVKAQFKADLAAGRKVIPACHPHECPDFDYSGKGCPGHAEEAL